MRQLGKDVSGIIPLVVEVTCSFPILTSLTVVKCPLSRLPEVTVVGTSSLILPFLNQNVSIYKLEFIVKLVTELN